MLRVVVVDGLPIVRRGIEAMLEDAGEFLVVGRGGDGLDAIVLIKDLAP